MMKPISSRAARAAASVCAVAVLASCLPSAAWACACGCGIFDVGGANLMMPSDSDTGLTVWARYSYMNQNHNWEGSSKGAAADNGDRSIMTSFYTPGVQYMINRDWTVMAEQPVFDRKLTTTDNGTGDATGTPNSTYAGRLLALGDTQLTGVYTGLSADMSTGLSLGVKLPTGDYHGPKGAGGGYLMDRDTLPGTGSTDLLIGGYHVGALTADRLLSYFVQARYQVPVLTTSVAENGGSYRPGNEFNTAVGAAYNLGEVGKITRVLPIFQVLGSIREHDNGSAAMTSNSGYERVLLAPAIDLRIDKIRLYADLELPVFQHANASGNAALYGSSGQLVASQLVKVQLSYDF